MEHIVLLCQSGAMKPFCDLLDTKDEKVLTVVMDGLANILSTASKHGEVENVCVMIEECDGLDKIKKLQNHENETVSKKALELIETFFAEEDEQVWCWKSIYDQLLFPNFLSRPIYFKAKKLETKVFFYTL